MEAGENKKAIIEEALYKLRNLRTNSGASVTLDMETLDLFDRAYSYAISYMMERESESEEPEPRDRWLITGFVVAAAVSLSLIFYRDKKE